MSKQEIAKVTEEQSRQVAEESRQKEWKQPSFLKELFLGSFRFDLIHPFPQVEERPEFREFFDKLKAFLRDKVDSVKIDETGQYGEEVVQGLRDLGAFGMKIPTEYGGLGLSQVEYDRVMKLIGGSDGNVGALLSAHQSIGVPQPIKLFGTEEQKKAFLPRCAKGAVSAFALTEPDVGSDPARLTTIAERTEDGDYIVSGEKLWCTNGTIAELFVVMAKHPDTNKISAFVVDGASEGVSVEHRCYFMGIRAIENGVIRFDKVRVPKQNLIGKEGAGLKIALVTLNTGRLALPASCSGAVAKCLEVVRIWSKEREQWGRAIGKHEAIAHKIADMAAFGFALESVSNIASRLADRGGYDIRLEAACAKMWNSEVAWQMVDETMQIRGGRGYETEASLAARGEAPVPVERIMRDNRINRIFEGSTEIMHLFIAREAVDTHLQVAEILIDPKKSFGQKMSALPKIAKFYATWYPRLFFGWSRWPKYSEHGRLGRHLGFCERSTRKLARQVFHGMLVHQASLQHRQGFLFRIVDIGTELFAMAASISRALGMKASGDPNAEHAIAMADLFCRGARRRIQGLFHALWSHDDALRYKVAQQVLAGTHRWIEEGVIKLDEAPATKALPGKAGAPETPEAKEVATA